MNPRPLSTVSCDRKPKLFGKTFCWSMLRNPNPQTSYLLSVFWNALSPSSWYQWPHCYLSCSHLSLEMPNDRLSIFSDRNDADITLTYSPFHQLTLFIALTEYCQTTYQLPVESLSSSTGIYLIEFYPQSKQLASKQSRLLQALQMQKPSFVSLQESKLFAHLPRARRTPRRYHSCQYIRGYELSIPTKYQSLMTA